MNRLKAMGRLASILFAIALFSSGITGIAVAQSAGKLEAEIAATRALISQDKIVEALEKLSLLMQESQRDPDAMLAMGEIFQELAGLRANRLQEVAPESTAAHELAGQSLESRGKLSEALDQYRRALERDSNAPGLHFRAGNVLWKLKNLESAEIELNEELKVNPHHAMANLRMGQILLAKEPDTPMRAVAYLKEATSDAGSSLEAHRELGKALRLADRYSEAIQELQLVETRNPNDDSVHAQLAALYRDIGDPVHARQEIEIHAKILRHKLAATQKAHGGEGP